MIRHGEGVGVSVPGDAHAAEPAGAPGKETLVASVYGATPAAGAGAAPGGAQAAGGGPLIVEDGGKVGPNQMTKSEFLREVHELVPDEDIAPWQARPCAALERDIRNRVSGAASAKSARDYLALIRTQAQAQQATGGGPRAAGAFGGDPANAFAAAGTSEQAAAEFMRSGGMGEGQPLETSARAAMESAFRHDFGAVRVHTNERAGALAGQLSARAFTVGSEIVFGAGTYAPGTPVGDALLAHELAHVVQQNGATAFGRGDSFALDADADQAAAYAVSALHGGAMSARAPATPSLRSGVGVQRCPGGGGGGGSGSALTFSSASHTPGTGGASVATPIAAGVQVQTSGYVSGGSVQATGGTDADAAEWDVGYLQLLRSTSRAGHYVGSPAATKQSVIMPANTRDGLTGTVAPWYQHTSPGKKSFTKTSSTETTGLGDQPQTGFAWTTPDGLGKLSHIDGKDTFTAWMVVRKRASPNTIQFINWETWEAGFGATTNYATTGAKTIAATTGTTTNTGSGAGQGSDTPNLTGPLANAVVTRTWS